MNKILLFIATFLLVSCNDNAIITKYDKNLKKVDCLKIVVFPPDELISSTINSLYSSKEKCQFELQISKKGGIVCNSNQNADKKALSNFPSGYIRFDIYKNHHLVYSYYKDLTSKITKDDIKDAFLRIKKDLL